MYGVRIIKNVGPKICQPSFCESIWCCNFQKKLSSIWSVFELCWQHHFFIQAYCHVPLFTTAVNFDQSRTHILVRPREFNFCQELCNQINILSCGTSCENGLNQWFGKYVSSRQCISMVSHNACMNHQPLDHTEHIL